MIETKLTKSLGLKHPIIQAPMAWAAGGELAAAVSRAGGLGSIGAAYGELDWMSEQFGIAYGQRVACGFITWAILQKPALLDYALEQQPAAMIFSFGNPSGLVQKVQRYSIPTICQVQTFRDAQHAIELGVDVIVAQGSEAGGHGEKRATFTLVPEVADYIAANAPKTLLCAAGGICDGRGLAAALMLGADGAVVGSRFWASKEALVHPNMQNAAIRANGDDTIRTKVVDLIRNLDWPIRYNARVIKNDLIEKWHNKLSDLEKHLYEETKKWNKGLKNGDPNKVAAFVGEVAGQIREIDYAETVLESISSEADSLLKERSRYVLK